MRFVNKHIAISICLAAFTLFAMPAYAALIAFDFTDRDVFGDLNRKTSFGPITIDGFEISLSASGRMTTNTGRDRRGCARGNPGTQNLACDGDGLGVGDDEISANGEWLSLTLNWLGIYTINSVEFLDLFTPEGGRPEYAQYEINDGGLNNVASQGLTGGYVFEPIGSIVSGLTTIDFSTSLNRRSDFALARIVVETQDRRAVPEPGILAILAAGLLISWALVGRRRA